MEGKKKIIPTDIDFGDKKDEVKKVMGALRGREEKVRIDIFLEASLYSFFQKFTSETQRKRKLNKKQRMSLGAMARIGLKLLKEICESNPEIFEEGTEEEIREKVKAKIKE